MDRPVLVWVRNDLRFHDNAAIYEATTWGQPVLLMYVYDPVSKDSSFPGGANRVWLESSL
jgi:deoxyribodipyrimidine photo-lyase